MRGSLSAAGNVEAGVAAYTGYLELVNGVGANLVVGHASDSRFGAWWCPFLRCSLAVRCEPLSRWASPGTGVMMHLM